MNVPLIAPEIPPTLIARLIWTVIARVILKMRIATSGAEMRKIQIPPHAPATEMAATAAGEGMILATLAQKAKIAVITAVAARAKSASNFSRVRKLLRRAVLIGMSIVSALCRTDGWHRNNINKHITQP